MKKRIKVLFITIILCLLSGVLTYFISLKIDLARKGGNVNFKVTFDDTETYTIPSIKKMDKSSALKEWPYKFQVTNSGNAKGLYQIKIEDISKSIKREDLDYVLILDGNEVGEGNLSKLKDNILYTYEIGKEQEQKYELYIWCINDVDDKDSYEYKLSFNVIKDGGPGF